MPVNLSGSTAGISYQLFLGATAMGLPVIGTGTGITFGAQTATGTYTVMATNLTTSCSATMPGSATVGLYPLPLVFNVTGGGNYCPGGTGVNIGLDGSTLGNTYQLYNGAPVGGPVAGTGLPISFGMQAGTGTYTVVAMNTTTSCTNNMAGSAAVNTYSLPTAYTVGGGGSYCSGTGGLHVTLSGSRPRQLLPQLNERRLANRCCDGRNNDGP